MTVCMHQPASTLYSQKMISLGSRLIACCKLAPTLARQMWRHNHVIDRNEYLIFTLSESINPWVYSQQFLFKSTNNSWRHERKCEWVFFSEHSVVCCEAIRSAILATAGLLVQAFSAQCYVERGIAMQIVRLSVHNVEVSWSHRLEIFKNNFTIS